MFKQIPDEDNAIMATLKSSVRERGFGATVLGGLGVLGIIALVGLLIIVSTGWGMTDASGAKRILTAEGYTAVTITGYRWFTCDRHDYFHTGFEAKGPTGVRVTGTVCKGMIFKSSTVRID